MYMASRTEGLSDLVDIAVRRLGYDAVKEEQKKIEESFVSGKDVFAVMPTGYGKSLCYACLPIVFDLLLGRETANHSIVIVTTPLTAIMKDQVSFTHHRIKNKQTNA